MLSRPKIIATASLVSISVTAYYGKTRKAMQFFAFSTVLIIIALFYLTPIPEKKADEPPTTIIEDDCSETNVEELSHEPIESEEQDTVEELEEEVGGTAIIYRPRTIVVAEEDDDLVFVRPPSRYETFPSPSRFRNLAKRVPGVTPARRRKSTDTNTVTPTASPKIPAISLIKRKRSRIEDDDSINSTPMSTTPEDLDLLHQDREEERAKERIASAYTKYRQLMKELPPKPGGRPSTSSSLSSSGSKVKNWFNSVSKNGSPHGSPNPSKLRISPIEVRRTSDSGSSIISIGSTWSNRVGAEVSESTSDKERKRQEAIFELIHTEQTYLRSLQQLMEVFFTQLGPILPSEVTEIVFGRVDEILLFNAAFLSELEERQKMYATHIQEVGDIVERHIQGVEVYRGYCVNQANASMLLKTLKNNDPVIREKLETLSVNQLKLEHYLLEPFQRITRYPILLQPIIRYTPENHPDHDRLSAAVRHTEFILSSINDDIRELEEDEVVGKISRTFLWDKSIEPMDFTASTKFFGKRKLLKEMSLVTGKSRRKLKGYIFNDLLIFVVPRESGKEKVYWGPLFLECLVIRPIEQTSTQFEVSNGERSLKLKADSPTSRMEIMTTLELQRRQCKDALLQLKLEVAQRARSSSGSTR